MRQAGKMPPTPPLILESLISWQRSWGTSADAKAPTVPRGMASSPTRNEKKKGSRQSQAATSATSLGGGPVLHSEEFLTRISTELTDEALFMAAFHMNPVPTEEKQTEDRGTQITKHVFFTKTRGTDTW
ncbi:putative protein T-ENOL [Camelus dromedarius]|uniref:Uncharacterized protein n=1 Tax=Camelus dromedarius TaxID=9838 RepID=A0A5N4CY02_CAMDR|nr:putative protein T-ENOL [Camelus dromedarius]